MISTKRHETYKEEMRRQAREDLVISLSLILLSVTGMVACFLFL